MSLVKNAIQELVLEMVRQNRKIATYYALNTGNGFHNIIESSETIDVIDIDNDVTMAIENIDIGTLKILLYLLKGV